MLANDWLALAVTFAIALAWLRLNDFTAHRGWISSSLSRKIIHIGTGPIFILCWALFTDSLLARFLAASVPFLITLQFALVGLGLLRDEAAVKAMSRSGDRREILHGPLLYGIAFVLLTLIYWRDSPIGMTALLLMSGGDGLADVFGRRYGAVRLPWNREKSWIGSLSMFLGGWLLSAFVLAIYHALELSTGSFGNLLLPLTVIAFGTTLVETLPFKDIDNLTTTLAAVLLGHLLF